MKRDTDAYRLAAGHIETKGEMLAGQYLFEAADEIDRLWAALEKIEGAPGEAGRVACAVLAGGCVMGEK